MYFWQEAAHLLQLVCVAWHTQTIRMLYASNALHAVHTATLPVRQVARVLRGTCLPLHSPDGVVCFVPLNLEALLPGKVVRVQAGMCVAHLPPMPLLLPAAKPGTLSVVAGYVCLLLAVLPLLLFVVLLLFLLCIPLPTPFLLVPAAHASVCGSMSCSLLQCRLRRLLPQRYKLDTV